MIDVKEFENKIEEIKSLVNEDISEKLDELDELINIEFNGIKNISNFISRLKIENLYTSEIEKFIDEYMRYFND